MSTVLDQLPDTSSVSVNFLDQYATGLSTWLIIAPIWYCPCGFQTARWNLDSVSSHPLRIFSWLIRPFSLVCPRNWTFLFLPCQFHYRCQMMHVLCIILYKNWSYPQSVLPVLPSLVFAYPLLLWHIHYDLHIGWLRIDSFSADDVPNIFHWSFCKIRLVHV